MIKYFIFSKYFKLKFKTDLYQRATFIKMNIKTIQNGVLLFLVRQSCYWMH